MQTALAPSTSMTLQEALERREQLLAEVARLEDEIIKPGLTLYQQQLVSAMEELKRVQSLIEQPTRSAVSADSIQSLVSTLDTLSL